MPCGGRAWTIELSRSSIGSELHDVDVPLDHVRHAVSWRRLATVFEVRDKLWKVAGGSSG
jgi:hypothetical protein